ncbi:Uncharacterized protein, DUF1810 family [Quadrisphaera granulorum]|uniref:Uncharacterized protein (DUF1810 family) n=1 Tax=Quadrisphaera granulorum TaxID=317664 RepID=A0A315ZVT0_9ACTN|nr:DUF1810 domain-containing protein [Quadrisphaera granulorum]PWJ49050.1 uncharacterized protein (DUF1810 family) [Quadrisphaera granulorum]SZE98260.1 Uncharacterized protein, DUF1810 family [Quadrisphaera granulorum]
MTTASESDPFDLQRFLDAQAGGTYEAALAELRAGRKRGHWIWFVLPQMRGLGLSATSQHYGVTGLAEARAYLAHPVLGPRLRECFEVLAGLPETDPVRVLGSIDAVKVRSSATLFAAAAPQEQVFTAVLDHWYGGHPDDATISRL